jgi:hypothetical protein
MAGGIRTAMKARTSGGSLSCPALKAIASSPRRTNPRLQPACPTST